MGIMILRCSWFMNVEKLVDWTSERHFDEQGDRISSHGGFHGLFSDRSIRNNVDRLFRSMCRETMTVNIGRRL